VLAKQTSGCSTEEWPLQGYKCNDEISEKTVGQTKTSASVETDGDES
jgi:hypothetical protein